MRSRLSVDACVVVVVVWSGVEWCGVVWCGVGWGAVEWSGVERWSEVEMEWRWCAGCSTIIIEWWVGWSGVIGVVGGG